jgi:lactate racemase
MSQFINIQCIYINIQWYYLNIQTVEASMEIDLSFGKNYLSLEIDEEKNLLGVITPNEPHGVHDPLGAIQEALANPMGSPTLTSLVKRKKPQSIVIVVNDSTRPTPYKYMLPPMMEELHNAGVTPEQIKFIIATGSHRANTDEENRAIFSDEYVEKYTFISHDCKKNLVSLGKLADGSEFMVNRHVAEADMVITTGLIQVHYFAGYSGGRKSILPGVVGKELITFNHSKMTDPRACAGNYWDNPVHWIMIEAARKIGVDFILNVVTNSQKKVVKAVAGELDQAWLAGVEFCDHMNIVSIKEPADVVIASAGGYPKDINVYQSQKALENAHPATKNGGTIILIASCPEGLGEKTFQEWVEEAKTLDDIFERFQQGFKLGGHKAFAIAQVLKEKEVILISDLGKEVTEGMFMRYAKDLDEAMAYVKEKHGDEYKAYVMPQAGMVLPVVR